MDKIFGFSFDKALWDRDCLTISRGEVKPNKFLFNSFIAVTTFTSINERWEFPLSKTMNLFAISDS